MAPFPFILYLLISCAVQGEPATCKRVPIGATGPIAGSMLPVIPGLTAENCSLAPGMIIAQMHWQALYSDQRPGGWLCELAGKDA